MTTHTSSSLSAIKRASIMDVTTAKGTLAKPVHIKYFSPWAAEPTVATFYTLRDAMRFILADASFMLDEDKAELLVWFERAMKKALTEPVGVVHMAHSQVFKGGTRRWELRNDTFDILCDYNFGRCMNKADFFRIDFDGKSYACDTHANEYDWQDWEEME